MKAFALLLDGEGRLVGYECEVHDGLHIGSSCPNTDAQEGILTGEDSVLGYRIPMDRFVVDSSPCECGRPGQRLRYSIDRIKKPMRAWPPPTHQFSLDRLLLLLLLGVVSGIL